jgi:hypothetical protein
MLSDKLRDSIPRLCSSLKSPIRLDNVRLRRSSLYATKGVPFAEMIERRPSLVPVKSSLSGRLRPGHVLKAAHLAR